jgi:hypothetical protein
MNYHQIDLKLDQFIQYVNDEKINLIPSFQRGHAWKLPMRQRLITNIVKGRPMPAIFLYRQTSQSGEAFVYNIRAKDEQQPTISREERGVLKNLFGFLGKAYKNATLRKTKLATNQIHFYTMATSIVAGNLMDEFSEDELIRKLAVFGRIIDEEAPVPIPLRPAVLKYLELSQKQTTHVSRRAERQEKFLEAIRGLSV